MWDWSGICECGDINNIEQMYTLRTNPQIGKLSLLSLISNSCYMLVSKRDPSSRSDDLNGKPILT